MNLVPHARYFSEVHVHITQDRIHPTEGEVLAVSPAAFLLRGGVMDVGSVHEIVVRAFVRLDLAALHEPLRQLLSTCVPKHWQSQVPNAGERFRSIMTATQCQFRYHHVDCNNPKSC